MENSFDVYNLYFSCKRLYIVYQPFVMDDNNEITHERYRESCDGQIQIGSLKLNMDIELS